jgi:hypothetical protein
MPKKILGRTGRGVRVGKTFFGLSAGRNFAANLD